MSDIAEIKRSLHDMGISQTKLAEILDTNLTTVNNWFSRGSIPRKHIDKIAQLLANSSTKHSTTANISQHSLIEPQNSPNMPISEVNIDYNHTKPQKSHYRDSYIQTSQESSQEPKNSLDDIARKNRATIDTGISHINLQNINDSTADSFAFDISLIPLKSKQNIKWDKIGDNIHIIDTNVDKYTGDGFYYLQYPHKYIFVDIVYLPFEQCYSINGLKEFNNIQLLKDIHHTIKGKVIYKITKL